MLVIEKFPDANAVEVVRRCECRAQRAAAGPARHRNRRIHLSVRPASSTCRSTISAWRCCIGAGLLVLVLAAWFFELARRVDQHRGDPAVAGGGGARPLSAWGDVQHDGPGGLRGRPGCRSSTMPSSTSRTSCAVCAGTAARAATGPRGDHFRSLHRDPQPLDLRHADPRAGGDRRFPDGRAARARSCVRLRSSYVLALLASMVVAMIVTPALAMVLLRGASLDQREPPLVRLLQRSL